MNKTSSFWIKSVWEDSAFLEMEKYSKERQQFVLLLFIWRVPPLSCNNKENYMNSDVEVYVAETGEPGVSYNANYFKEWVHI